MTENRCAIIFGEPMKPCPECGSFELKYQTPIKLDADTDLSNPKKLISEWAKKRLAHEDPLLEGPCYLMCFGCFHKGPAVDCTGRTSGDVSHDPVVCKEIKRLWNTQKIAE